MLSKLKSKICYLSAVINKIAAYKQLTNRLKVLVKMEMILRRTKRSITYIKSVILALLLI